MQQLLTRDEEISAKQHEISVREHELVAVRAEVSELVMALANARDELEEETRHGRSRCCSAGVPVGAPLSAKCSATTLEV